jgi:signal transduction histidine kinase
MGTPNAKRRLFVPVILIGCGLAVCGWQVEEHVRFRTTARDALINRGRDIASTLGVLVKPLRSRSGVVAMSKERLQSGLQELIRPEGYDWNLESIEILAATGEVVASAGDLVPITPEMLAARGIYWQDRTLTVMTLMDLGTTGGEDGSRPRPAIIVNEDQARAMRNGPPRRSSEDRANGDSPPAATTAPVARSSPPPAESAAPATPANSTDSAPANPPVEVVVKEPAQSPPPRPVFMSRETYNELIQKQGIHSLVISLSTIDMHRAINADLLLRSLVSLLAMGGAIASMLAWRNVERNAELQIRLVKAGEMNTHLKEMNLAAAGLAHETRNPLNLIRGLAQMIAMQSKEVPKLKEHASTIVEEADRVTVQLNEFINYSKPRETHIAPVQVSRLVADVARTLLPDVEEKRIQLNQPESNICVEADEQLMRQAIFNVLLNATQAVAPGGRIDVRLSPAGAREVTLEISDDGPGVPVADRASIFKPYVTMRPKGVGLGLAIVAQIAAAHHWEVSCEGNEPHGAVFRFSHLKIAAASA